MPPSRSTSPTEAFAKLSLEGTSSSSLSSSRPKTHQTLPIDNAIPRREVAPLLDIVLAYLADNANSIVDIRGLDETLSVRLLREVLARGKLDCKLCKVFMTSGHKELEEAVSALNFFDALSCQGGNRGLGCR